MADHSQFAQLAEELIAAEGRQVRLQKLSKAVADASKPWNGMGAPTVELDVPTFAAFLPAQGSGLGTIVTDKDLLKTVEQVALVPPGTQDLSKMTRMLDEGEVWAVKWVQVLKPANQICLYVFGVSR